MWFEHCRTAASLGSLEKKLAADGEQKLNLELDEVVQRMATADEAMQASMASLATKIQQSTISVEATAGNFVVFHKLVGESLP